MLPLPLTSNTCWVFHMTYNAIIMLYILIEFCEKNENCKYLDVRPQGSRVHRLGLNYLQIKFFINNITDVEVHILQHISILTQWHDTYSWRTVAYHSNHVSICCICVWLIPNMQKLKNDSVLNDFLDLQCIHLLNWERF